MDSYLTECPFPGLESTANYKQSMSTATFAAPEYRFLTGASGRDPLETAHIYSLGVALYYTADFRLPHSVQPKLSDELEAILAQMAEESVAGRIK